MTVQIVESRNRLSSLQKQWAGLSLFGAALLAAQFFGLLAAWPEHAWRWLALAVAGFAWLSWTLWRGLALNYTQDSKHLSLSLGPGTQLTFLRGLFLAFLAGLLFSPRPPGWLAWLPGLYYTLAALADLFDGYLARRSGLVTRLGERLDLNLDGAGVLIAAILAVQYGQAPAWYLLVGLVRYLFVAWTWLLRQGGLPVYDLPPSATRRPFAGAQMGALAVLLWPVFGPPGTHLAAALFAIPFLVGFTLDGLAVGGWRPFSNPEHTGSIEAVLTGPANLSGRVSWLRAFIRWSPAVLRLVVVLLLMATIYEQLVPRPIFEVFQNPPALAQLGFGLFGLVLLSMGAAGRLGALAVLFAAGFHQHLEGLDLVDLLLVAGSTGLFFLGTGPLSLWKPEDHLIRRRLGETQGVSD